LARVNRVANDLEVDPDQVTRALKAAKGALWFAENAPAGSRGRASKLDSVGTEKVLNALNKNGSVSATAKALDVSTITLNSFIERNKIRRGPWKAEA